MTRQLLVSLVSIPVLLLVFAAAPALAQCDGEIYPASSLAAAAEIAAAPTAEQPLDINTATKDQLKLLPGIDDVFADKIVTKRPFKLKTDLKTKKIIPTAAYDKIEKLIIVKLAQATPTP